VGARSTSTQVKHYSIARGRRFTSSSPLTIARFDKTTTESFRSIHRPLSLGIRIEGVDRSRKQCKWWTEERKCQSGREEPVLSSPGSQTSSIEIFHLDPFPRFNLEGRYSQLDRYGTTRRSVQRRRRRRDGCTVALETNGKRRSHPRLAVPVRFYRFNRHLEQQP